MQPRRDDLPALTIVRFFAAMLVVFFHYGKQVTPNWALDTISSGYNGVTLFFILSGFILVYVSRPNDDARAFWLRRFARIYPVYFIAWAAFGYYLFLSNDAGPTYLAKVFVFFGGLSLFLLQSWVPSGAQAWNWPGWSLSTESFFYAVFPRLNAWMKRLGTLLPLLVVTLLVNTIISIVLNNYLVQVSNVPLLAETFLQTTWGKFLGTFPPSFIMLFVAGAALGHVFLRRGAIGRNWWPALATLCVVLLALPGTFGLPRDAYLAPAFCALIYSLASVKSVGKLARGFVLLGQASYSIYILQSPMWKFYWLVKGIEPQFHSTADVLAFVTLLVAISVLVYLFVERPAERLIKARLAGVRAARGA